MTEKYPISDWSFDDDIETQFQEWFNNEFYGNFSFRNEAFFFDCLIGDPKTRQDLLYKWIYASFYEGYNRAMYKKLEEGAKN